MNRKAKFINAYAWMYDATKKAAEKVYKTASEEYIDVIIEGFEQNAKSCFYKD